VKSKVDAVTALELPRRFYPFVSETSACALGNVEIKMMNKLVDNALISLINELIDFFKNTVTISTLLKQLNIFITKLC
jgi:hypothetical protein